MSPDPATLVWLQAWTGAPVYLLAAVTQGLLLHRAAGLSIGALSATVLFSAVLSVLAGVVIWGRYFAGVDILLWQAVNLPALIAAAVVFPLVGMLVAWGLSDASV